MSIHDNIMKKPLIIPFFIPHQGCPHTCLFCDQHQITGRHIIPDTAEIRETIARYIKSAGKDRINAEVAFFGGSFTALPLPVQKNLLFAVKPFLSGGGIDSIRVSTRPDYIDEKICTMLREHGVKTVELGAQSFHDHVLSLAQRGHSAADTIRAVSTIKLSGLDAGIQLMPGLPGEKPGQAQESARITRDLHPSCVRVYPAVVLAGTGLAEMYARGEYTPLTIEEAVETASDITGTIEEAGIPVIRIGLHPLSPEHVSSVMAGPYHPAMGFLVRARMKRRILDSVLAEFESAHDVAGKNILVMIPFSKKEEYTGMAKGNLLYLKEKYMLKNIRLYASEGCMMPECSMEK